MRDRARGALLGLACGDAVGTTVEFSPPGSFEPLTDMVGGGPFDLEPGQWTDDTSMALCMAESIIDTGRLDLADHHRRYLMWRHDGYLSSNGRCFDIGHTTATQLRRFESTGVAVDPSPSEHAAANGSLMRLAPAPIAWHRDLAEAAEQSGESSRSTHAARRPVDACRVLGAMTAAFVQGMSADEVFAPTFWQWGELDPEVAAIVAGSYREKEPPEIRGTGFCVDALEAALWAVYGASDFRDAVLRAANLGDDADTTAAIAGQLAGARWGAEGIPARWVVRVSMCDRIVSLGDALFDLHSPEPRPHVEWPNDRLIHAWWVEPGRVLAGEYPGLPLDGPRRMDERIHVLLDAGIRTIVDLTSSADPLDPYHDKFLALGATRGLEVRHERRSIPDLGTIDLDGYREVVEFIRSENAASRGVYVHCWGGIGRTGTVVGCLLAEPGETTDEVLARIAGLRAGTRKADRRSPENDEQIAVIGAWIEGLTT